MSSQQSIRNLHQALQSIRSESANLQTISFYQSQSRSGFYRVTENSISIYISTNKDDAQCFCDLLNELAVQGSNCSKLTEVAFHGIEWEQKILQSLQLVLDKTSNIKQLEFQSNIFGTKGMLELSKMLKTNFTIKVILLSNSHIGCSGAMSLASALTENETLEELQIWEDSIGSKGAEDLARMIEVNPTLKLMIVLDKESMTATPIISAIIGRNRTMEAHIWSRDNSVISSKVVEFTPENSTLKIYKLNLSDSCRVVCAMVRNTTIQTLDMTGIRLKSKWAKEFRRVLEHNRSLKEVKLSRASLRDKAIVYIAAGLFKNQFLENLELEENWFSGVGVEHLLCPVSRFSAVSSQANTTLRSLAFGGQKTKIGRNGLLAILRMLETNQTIVQLRICGDISLKSDDIVKLFKALERNATLRCLSLERCLGVQGETVMQTIMETLQVNPWIEEIDLAGTPLQVAGKTNAIYEKLGQNGSAIPEKDLVNDLPMTMPKCCRIFLCGQEFAGKRTLCSSIYNKMDSIEMPYMDRIRALVNPIEQIMQRPDIKIKTMYDDGTKISIWSLSGNHETLALNDLMFPSYGSPSFFVIVSSLYQKPANQGLKNPDDIEEDILYWLKFIVSNSKRPKSQPILPHTTIVLTHLDKVPQLSQDLQPIANSIQRFRERFQGHVEFYPTVFTVDARSSVSVSKLTHHLRKVSKTILQRVPQVFQLCNDLEENLLDWTLANSHKPAMNWKEFSELCQHKVPALRYKSRRDNIEVVEKQRCQIASSLHNIGEVIFFEELGFLILDCEWFYGEVISQLLQLSQPKVGKDEKNSLISRENLEKILKGTLNNKTPWRRSKYCDPFDAGVLIKMMLKLELCYEKDPGDPQTLLFVPTILEEGRAQMGKWQLSDPKCVYVGRQLEYDDLHVFLTRSFFPRLQVHLYNKIMGSKNPQGATYSLERNIICIISNGIHVRVELGGQLANHIDVLACSTKNVNDTLKFLDQLLIPAIKGLCSSINFTENIIRPDCVKCLIPHKYRKTQTLPLQQLKEVLLSLPADCMYNYQHTWSSIVCSNSLILSSGFDYARDLLSDDDFREVLHRRYYDLHHLATELVVPLERTHEAFQMVVNDPERNVEPSLSSIANGIDLVLRRLKILQQEIRDLKQEIQGLRYYEHHILIEVQRKINYLVNYNIQIQERKVPNLFYFIQVQNHSRRLVTRMFYGMTALRLHILCEFRREIHVVDDQIGCELLQVDNETIKCLLPYMSCFMKLVTFALKIGVHIVAGMGEMIPDLSRELAHWADSSLIYGATAMTLGTIGAAAIERIGGKKYRNRNSESLRNIKQDVRGAQQWLVDFFDAHMISTGKDIAERFGLWRVRYRDDGSIGWICRRHMITREHEVIEVPI